MVGAIAIQLCLMGMLCGLVLGISSRVTDFCTLGAFETAVLGRDYRRLHIWAIAVGVAIATTQLAAMAGYVDLHGTISYLTRWNPVASIAGGLIFGYGMALAGNCGFGAAIRAGSGDIRSFVLLGVIGVSAQATLAGPLAPLRHAIFPVSARTEARSIGAAMDMVTGLPPGLAGVAVGGALILLGLRHPAVRASVGMVGGAVGVGAAVTLSLLLTSAVRDESVSAIYVEGPSFTVPIGRSILYFMTSIGTVPDFSVGLVLGTILGAFLVAVVRKEVRLESCDDPRELGRQVCGAVLMGIGGVIAVGCTIGQGLTAMATLAWSGPVTLMAICAGAYVGLQQLVAQVDG